MAEFGGSPTDGSTINLGSSESGPTASNQPPREGALKRPADNNDLSVNKKKKKSAEELASSTRGRNVQLKKKLAEHKKNQKKQQVKTNYSNATLLEHRERLLERLHAFEEREMLLNDKAEEKQLKIEDTYRKALASVQLALKNNGEANYDEDEQNVLQSLSIHIPEWPCLDNHVQDFAFDRVYMNRENGAALTEDDMINIVNKVKSRDPTIGLPSKKDTPEFDRLLATVNRKVLDAVHERRFEHLVEDLHEYPGVDPNLKVEEKVRVKTEEEEDQLKAFQERVMEACGSADDGVDLIDLVDDDDVEGDDDELDEKEEDVDEDEELKIDEDLNLIRGLENYHGEKEEEEMVDPPEQDATEEESQIDYLAEKMKEDGPDSRFEKEIMEGGTSTNSPTLERDERMKDLETLESEERLKAFTPEERAKMMQQLENIDLIKAEIVGSQATTSAVPAVAVAVAVPEAEAEEEVVEAAPDNGTEKIVFLGANTIVLDDDDEEEEGKPVAVVEEEGPAGIGPPLPAKMTAAEAWQVKVKDIRLWISRITPEEMKEQGEEEEEAPAPVERDEEEEDDEIVCIEDDFEMDSVSHSGLQIRKQQGGGVAAAAAVKVEQKKEEPEEIDVIELD